MKVENIGELQIWIEGQFALVRQTQNTTSEDIKAVRNRVHDLSNEVQKLLALDLEGKMRKLEETDDLRAQQISKLTAEQSERRGALAVLKALYTTCGLIGGSVVTLVLQRILDHAG
jgi:hypothetical protein